ADVPHPPRTTGARVLLVKDHLLLDSQTATAVLARPTDAGPAAGRKLALPLLAQRRLMLLVAGTAAKLQRRKLAAQVFAHPLRDFDAEGLVCVPSPACGRGWPPTLCRGSGEGAGYAGVSR